MLKRGRGVEGCPLSYFPLLRESKKWVSAPLRDSLSIIYGLEHQVQAGYDRGESLILEKSMTDEKEPKPKLTLEQKIEQQEQKLKQLKAQQEAKLAKEKERQKEQDRKDDTRIKILLGSYLKKKMDSNPDFNSQILDELENYLTAERDRKLFGLSPLDQG